jgi:hypothetical protein
MVGGSVAKDGFAFLVIMLILCFAFMKHKFRTIETFFVWFFTYNFLLGQGYITVEIVSKYIAKPSFLLFLVLILFIKSISLRVINTKYIIIWGFFLLLALLSSITQGQSPFVIITISSFFMIYLLLQAKGITPLQCRKLLNLFVAAAILQTVVSFLQVSEMIPPPTRMMDDGAGGQFEWVAGLDDVASGTMGPGSGHITSWYAATVCLLLLLVWSITKKMSYLIFTAITFLQFATVDSKTIMGVSVLMFGYMLFYLFKEKKRFRLNIGRYLFFIIIIAVGAFGFVKAWNAYYVYYGEQTGGSRTELSAVYENEGIESVNLVLDDIGEWGKIRGFLYVLEDFIDNDPKQLIWGYGIQGYNYNDKMGLIESKDTALMQLNNLTNSRSGLIGLFAKSGLVGFILFFMAIYQWFNYHKRKAINNFDLIKISLLKIYLPFTFLAAFLYAIDINSIPVIVFAAIISIYSRLSDYDRLNKL